MGPMAAWCCQDFSLLGVADGGERSVHHPTPFRPPAAWNPIRLASQGYAHWAGRQRRARKGAPLCARRCEDIALYLLA